MLWGRGFALVSTGNEKLCTPKLREDVLEILAVNMGEQTQKKNITADTNASLVTWEQRLVET